MTYHPVDWWEIIKGHPSAFFAISKNNNIPLLIANCVRVVDRVVLLKYMCCLFNFRMFNLTGSLKQFCVCTLIPSWLKNTNTLRISYQLKHSLGVEAWFMYLIWFIMWQQAETLIFVQWIYFLFVAFYNFITEFVVHCVHLDLDICTWTYHLLNLS